MPSRSLDIAHILRGFRCGLGRVNAKVCLRDDGGESLRYPVDEESRKLIHHLLEGLLPGLLFSFWAKLLQRRLRQRDCCEQDIARIDCRSLNAMALAGGKRFNTQGSGR